MLTMLDDNVNEFSVPVNYLWYSMHVCIKIYLYKRKKESLICTYVCKN